MDKINRFRTTQVQSFEDFFNDITDKGICKYCDSYKDCMEYMGEENMESMSGNGCGGFDASIEDIKKHFLLEQCAVMKTI